MCSQKVDSLMLQLKSATKHKLLNEQLENQLRSIDRSLTVELTGLKNEIDFLAEELENIMKNISELKYQIANIKVCNISEQCKTKLQIENLDEHSNGFMNLYAQDKDTMRYQQNELKTKEIEVEELRKRHLEINEMENKKALAVEKECESIESACTVLKKRNKAIMLNLRRYLLETDEIRRNLMRNKIVQTP